MEAHQKPLFPKRVRSRLVNQNLKVLRRSAICPVIPVTPAPQTKEGGNPVNHPYNLNAKSRKREGDSVTIGYMFNLFIDIGFFMVNIHGRIKTHGE